jgi:hypothetical protein
LFIFSFRKYKPVCKTFRVLQTINYIFLISFRNYLKYIILYFKIKYYIFSLLKEIIKINIIYIFILFFRNKILYIFNNFFQKLKIYNFINIFTLQGKNIYCCKTLKVLQQKDIYIIFFIISERN